MSLQEELIIHDLLHKALFYTAHKLDDDSYGDLAKKSIDEADELLKKNIRESFTNFSYETIIYFAETALKVEDKEELSNFYINLFFQRNKSKGQIYIRALFLKARLISNQGHQKLLKAEEMIQNIQKSLSYVNEAIEIISKPENKIDGKPKYGFLIYNASICVYEIVRPMLRMNWQKHFVDIVEKIDKLFDEVDESDYNWRCRFTLVLFQCIYDADKKQDAFKYFEKLWETTKKKGDCEFQDELLRLRIHYGKENNNMLAAARKDADAAPSEKGWKQLVILQSMKSGIITEAQMEKELITLIKSISPSVLQGQEVAAGSNKLSPILQERMAEAGRIALTQNILDIAAPLTAFLTKVRHLSSRAYILNEYNKAELLVKQAGPTIDDKTKFQLNGVQLKKQEVERRKEALKILEKAMITNKKSNFSDLIYEGAVLIWNISLSFINAQYRQHINKAFEKASQLLEQIQSNDHALRVNFHLEIAKFYMQDDNVSEAESHIKKALELDYSIPLNKITQQYNNEEDLSLYQRPYDRYLNAIKTKINLKQNLYEEPKDDDIEWVIVNLDRAINSKMENLRIDILQKCFGFLYKNELRKEEYVYNPELDLVEEEINKQKILFKQQNLVKHKQRKLLAAEIAKYAFEWDMNDLAQRACEFVIQDQWDIKNSAEMILSQVECYYILAQCAIIALDKEGFEIAYKDFIKISDEGEDEQTNVDDMTEEQKQNIINLKKSVIDYYLQGLKLANDIQQTWLIFNGAIYIWNNFLPIFRNPTNDNKLLPDIMRLLQDFFEVMKNSMKELEKKELTDYDNDSKIQVFANIGQIYARLLEKQGKHDDVMKICEALLLTPLSPHTRKLITAIKARVSGVAKAVPQKQVDKKGQQAQQQTSETVIFDVVSLLEVIQNTSNKQTSQELIEKCFKILQGWEAKTNDETELEMHAELWARLARQALKENLQMHKYSLRCVESALSLLPANADLQNIPQQRLRWYSLTEYLYSDTLIQMLNPETQETESQEQLLFHALKHAVEAANKGAKANINSLVLDASKQIWNICAKLQDSAVNRKNLIKPIFSTISYLKSIKEKSEPDLILLLSQLLFKACLENEEYQKGENAADMVFELVPKPLQKPIWEAKMIFMSKQGKNELQAISNMKEADASLQAKVWIRLARASNLIFKQYTAYNRAIDILKKESSVEIVEVYIEFSEWLLRNNYQTEIVTENLMQAADLLLEIEYEEEDEDEDEEKAPTVFSRSSRGKKSTYSKNSKTKSKISQSGKNKFRPNRAPSKSGDQKSQKSMGMKSVSKMSRASSRGTKTKMTKQSKSIFSVREEDAQPEFLNCLHYERLVRIHSMLASVARNQEQQIQYCLDSKFFLQKIVELSFKTLNQQDQNSLQYTQNLMEKDDKGQANQDKQKQAQQSQAQGGGQPQAGGVGNKVQQLKYMFPTSIQEWINLQFTKDFIEKVKSSEDYNFMGKFIFEKAELTFYYVNSVIDILENCGLHVHNVPLYIFQRFLAKEVIQSKELTLIIETKFARNLYNIGFQAEGDQILQRVNFTKLNLTDQEKKENLNKVESSRIHQNSKAPSSVTQTQQFGQTETIKPFLIKSIETYKIWIDIAQELIKYGEISRGKEFLEESMKHAQILKDIESVALIYHLQAQVAYIEGDYKNSLVHHMKAHRWIKNIGLWELNAVETVRTLKRQNPVSDIEAFLNKMISVIQNLQNQQEFQYNSVEISQCLSTLYILLGKTLLSQFSKQFSYTQFKKAIASFENCFNNIQLSGMTLLHLNLILKPFFKISIVLESQNFCDRVIIEKSYKIFEALITKLLKIEDTVKGLLKYTMILEKESQKIQGPLNFQYNFIKIQIAKNFTNVGILKKIMRSIEYRSGNAYDSKLVTQHPTSKPETPEKQQNKAEKEADEKEQNQIKEEEQDKMTKQFSEFEPLNNYLVKLTMQIERELQPIPYRLESFEKSIAILTSMLPKIRTDNYIYQIAHIELAKAKRYLALQKHQVQNLWLRSKFESGLENLQMSIDSAQIVNQDEEQDQFLQSEDQFQVDFKAESLKFIIEIQENQNLQENLSNIFLSKQAFYYSKLFCQELLENFGNSHPNLSFENLAKYQHFSNIKLFLNVLKQSASQDYKPLLLQRLNKYIQLHYQKMFNESLTDQLKKNYKIWDRLYFNLPNFNENLRDFVPNNSGFLIIQLSSDRQYLYTGFMKIDKQRKTTFNCYRKKMTNQDYDQIEIISNNIHQIKQTLIKTPIITDEELEKLEQDENKNYEQLMKTFEKFCSFFTKELDYLINQPAESDAQQTDDDNKDKKGGKGAPAQDKGGKKGGGGSDQQQFYESPLKATLGSVESITLLVDNQLYDLPFENLEVLKNVPAKSRDFSFYFLLKRYQKIQFSPSANNSTQAGGLQRDKLKYICYDFKQEEGSNVEINACNMIKEGIQDGVFSNLKFQGVRSDERIASIGEWQNFLSNSSLLLFYAHSSILDIMSPKFLCDMIEINETKGFVVFDRINCRKTLIQKSSPLDVDGQKVPIADQPLKTSILLTLLGCTNIAINQWSIKPEEYIKALKSMLQEFNKEIYFSAILNNYKEPKFVYINKLGQIVDINKLQDDKQKGQAASKDPKKQGKKDDKKEEIEQQQINIEDLQKFTEVKKLIYTDNVQFIGVPIIRLT